MRLQYRKIGKRYHWPWDQMSRGDYVIVPRRLAHRASCAAYNYGARRKWYVSCEAFGNGKRVKIRRLHINRV